MADGRRYRALSVVDDFCREALAIVIDTSLSGARMARVLEKIMEIRSYPRMVVSNNGTELISDAILKCADVRRVEWRLHCTRQAHAERYYREFQRTAARRMPE